MPRQNRFGIEIDADNIAEEIAQITKVTSKEIERIVEESVKSGALGDQNFFRRQEAKILNLVNRANYLTAPRAVAAIKSGYMEGALKTRERLAAFIGIDMNQPFGVAEQKAVEILASDTVNRLTDMNSSISRKATDIMKQGALQDISNINVSGEVFETATDKFKDAIIKAGLTERDTGLNLVKVGDRFYNPESYSRLVIKTESRAAHSQGVKNKLLENDMDVVEVSSHSTSCDICGEWDGNKYSITGATPGLPILDEYPPFHPNCQHVITASVA